MTGGPTKLGAVLLALGLFSLPGRAEDAAPATGAPGLPAEPIPMLRFNPFVPPAVLGRGGGEVAGAPGFGAFPRLTGTLVAGPQSLANLGGWILGLGEEAHGYRLVEVREGEAVFERDGRPLVLRVDDEEAAP